MHRIFYAGANMTTKNPTPLAEKLDATLAEIQTLTKTVEQLTEKVKGLEEMVKESNDILVAFSQSYYWTPEWQAKEERADEDDRLGRFKKYDDVEEFIREMNG